MGAGQGYELAQQPSLSLRRPPQPRPLPCPSTSAGSGTAVSPLLSTRPSCRQRRPAHSTSVRAGLATLAAAGIVPPYAASMRASDTVLLHHMCGLSHCATPTAPATQPYRANKKACHTSCDRWSTSQFSQRRLAMYCRPSPRTLQAIQRTIARVGAGQATCAAMHHAPTCGATSCWAPHAAIWAHASCTCSLHTNAPARHKASQQSTLPFPCQLAASPAAPKHQRIVIL